MKDNTYIMWLTRIEGLGSVKVRLLLNKFEKAENIFNADIKTFENLKFLNKNNILSIISMQKKFLLEKYEDELFKKEIRFISIYDKDYPKMLLDIVTPPVGIYILGNLPDESLVKISVIGSRRCSEYGLTMAYKISKDLAKEEVVIVSGMAKGIDSMSHRGALDAKGYTIAVLGCGIDVCYPAENKFLKQRILEKGCIISEYPPGVKPMPGLFPLRNRIISGLSLATLVVEAAEKSGTLITVEQALEQGRDVLAIPGNVTSKLSVGTNRLIKEGACLVTSCTDVLDSIGVIKNNKSEKKFEDESLAPDEKLVYDCISLVPISVEEIILKLNSQYQIINYVLTILEIKGLIIKLSGQRYIRYM